MELKSKYFVAPIWFYKICQFQQYSSILSKDTRVPIFLTFATIAFFSRFQRLQPKDFPSLLSLPVRAFMRSLLIRIRNIGVFEANLGV
jgi:hypothetical protein